MSDEAPGLKLAFGALVLVFCGVMFVARKGPDPTGAGARTQTPVVAASATDVAPPAPAPSSAPLDVQEDTPVRIEVTLHDETSAPAAAPAAAQPRASSLSRHAPRPAHMVPSRAFRTIAVRSRSPYAIGKKHYPYNARDAVRSGEVA